MIKLETSGKTVLPENTPKIKPFLEDTDSKKNFQKRARSKFFSQPLATALAAMTYENGKKSPLEKSYRNTIYCNNVLVQEGAKVKAKEYCGNRWCVVCSRIRTAKLMNFYLPEIDKLKDKQFVTLTVPNCKGEELQETIIEMKRVATSIKKDLNNQSRSKKHTKNGIVELKGLQKLECTWNHHTNRFHPHFHYILEGKAAAKALVKMWLERVDADPNAQYIVPCSDKGIKTEDGTHIKGSKAIFKYFTKTVTKLDEKIDFKILVRPLDTIFLAMRGLRTFNALGIYRSRFEDKKDSHCDALEEVNTTEDIQGLESEMIDITADNRVFTWVRDDWWEITEDGALKQPLSGYKASEAMITLTNRIGKVLNVKHLKLKEGDEIEFTFQEAITEAGMNYLFGFVNEEGVALNYSYLWKHLDRTVGKTFLIKNEGVKAIKNSVYKMFMFGIKPVESSETNLIALSKVVRQPELNPMLPVKREDMLSINWREEFTAEREEEDRATELMRAFEKKEIHETDARGSMNETINQLNDLNEIMEKPAKIEKIRKPKRLRLKEGMMYEFTFEKALQTEKEKQLIGIVNGERIYLCYDYLWQNLVGKENRTFRIAFQGVKNIENMDYKMYIFSILEIGNEKNY